MNEGFTFHDLEAVASREYGMSAEETSAGYERAIHCGILEVDPNQPITERHLRMPVPSFRSYAATGFDRGQTLSLMRRH